jgi:hypothetical protein
MNAKFRVEQNTTTIKLGLLDFPKQSVRLLRISLGWEDAYYRDWPVTAEIQSFQIGSLDSLVPGAEIYLSLGPPRIKPMPEAVFTGEDTEPCPS